MNARDDEKFQHIRPKYSEPYSKPQSEKTPEAVNHPKHYNSHPSGVECITIVEWCEFNIGNAMKYLWRSGEKGGEATRIEDLKKARWYVEREIQRLEGLEK